LVLAAAVCAAKRPIQKLLMHQPKFMSYGDLRVFRHCGPPSIRRSRTRSHNCEGKNVSSMRKLSKHLKSCETRIASVRIRAYEFEWDARPSS
jgi:hypothetical protein